jgi:hypothetical protein
MNVWPSAIMRPQAGVGGGGPRPRNDSPDSVMMAPETRSAPWTMIGASTLGSTCWKMIATLPTPASRAASMYGSSFTASTSPRVTRAKGAMKPTATAMITLRTPNPITAIMAIARMMIGNAKSPSMIRMITVSTMPP